MIRLSDILKEWGDPDARQDRRNHDAEDDDAAERKADRDAEYSDEPAQKPKPKGTTSGGSKTPESKVAKDAKAKGLENLSFGRWGKNGIVTHTSKDGKLTPVEVNKPAPGVMDPVIGPNQDPKVQTRRGGAVRSWPQPEMDRAAQDDIDGSKPASEFTPAEKLQDSVKARDMVMKRLQQAKEQGDTATIQKYGPVLYGLHDRIKQIVSSIDPNEMDPHMRKYLQNRGFLPDEEPDTTPRDATGASHFGPDQ